VPTYEYRCKDCGHDFEAVQAFTEATLTECPACGGQVRKVFGNVGIAFKGSGFYKTDSRAGSKANGSSKSEAGDGSKSDSSKSESSKTESSKSDSSKTGSPKSGSSKSDSSSSSTPGSSKSDGGGSSKGSKARAEPT